MTTVLQARNVNGLLALGVDHLAHEGVRGESRAGPVIVAPTPVMSVYERPTERVLVSARRDANPFFHLLESLWMLAGRDDATFLDHYVKNFGKRFAESDGTIHGAYGRRWRSSFGRDQLDVIVEKLRKNPDDRQCVLQIWGGSDLVGVWRDRPCNTHVYLRVRREPDGDKMGVPFYKLLLDLTVCCRSNDVIWGAYGANAVHFSVLQEYLAGRIGVGVGRMYQLSNNYHGYVDALDRLGDPVRLMEEPDYYEQGYVSAMPIGEHWESWDSNLVNFMQWHDELWKLPMDSNDINVPDDCLNLWFYVVAAPVVQCMWLWRAERRREALSHCTSIEASDWQLACLEWMQRRMVG